MNDPVILRKHLRAALRLSPLKPSGKKELTETLLKLAIERLLGCEISVPEFRDALEWNHVRGLVEFRFDDEVEANYWELTTAGKLKEGVK